MILYSVGAGFQCQWKHWQSVEHLWRTRVFGDALYPTACAPFKNKMNEITHTAHRPQTVYIHINYAHSHTHPIGTFYFSFASSRRVTQTILPHTHPFPLQVCVHGPSRLLPAAGSRQGPDTGRAGSCWENMGQQQQLAARAAVLRVRQQQQQWVVTSMLVVLQPQGLMSV